MVFYSCLFGGRKNAAKNCSKNLVSMSLSTRSSCITILPLSISAQLSSDVLKQNIKRRICEKGQLIAWMRNKYWPVWGVQDPWGIYPRMKHLLLQMFSQQSANVMVHANSCCTVKYQLGYDLTPSFGALQKHYFCRNFATIFPNLSLENM